MYHYYKSASRCHILLEMEDVWNPLEIVDNLKFVDHVLAHMDGAALVSEATRLTDQVVKTLSDWADTKPWAFSMRKAAVMSAAIDLGVLNCYSTCIGRVRSLFDNLYFSRVWTFQEMLLGKNITLWGINAQRVSFIGELDVWMDLATDSRDKAYKLQDWIDSCRVLNPASVNAVQRIIESDEKALNRLQTVAGGITSARTDIIMGGPSWWYKNHNGVSNIFSAISIIPRNCSRRADFFEGLLGIFHGLFTADELKRDMDTDDINVLSFVFLKQLSLKTGYAWTKLAISEGERFEWDWIPVMPNPQKVLTTDCFSGVVTLGVLKQGGLGQAVASATTGITGVPRPYMRIRLTPAESRGFQFYFKGCNCGKQVRTGLFGSQEIGTFDQRRDVVGDETGSALVHCATILGTIMDPINNVVEYRETLLSRLQPRWRFTDPSAKPKDWVQRCVSGTDWEAPHPHYFRLHNRSMNYRLVDMTGCGSRLENATTANLSCEVRVNCGCTVVAPYSFIFEAITAVWGSPLGVLSGTLDKASKRIILRDGLGLVQVGDVGPEGKTFSMVAFGGDVDAFRSDATQCRKRRIDKDVQPRKQWPAGRALVKEEFTHGATDMMRDYGYVETGVHQMGGTSCGNLLICRAHPLAKYKVVGVCVDGQIANNKGRGLVTIQ